MQTRNDKKAIRVAFDSLHEMGEYVKRTPRSPIWTTQDSRDIGAKPSWDLGVGYDGAVELARMGWLEGAKRAEEALKAFPSKTPEPDTRTDFYGFRPHVPRFCAGALDSMIRHTTAAETGHSKVLTLYASVMAHGGTSARAMANYGIGIAQYVNQLEAEGRRVEVAACATVGCHDGRRFTVSAVLKGADQPLDLAVLTFALGHPAMLRRIWFAYMERQPHVATLSGYGRCEDTRVSDLIDPALGTYVLNGMNQADTCAATPEKALAHVIKEIDKAIEQQEL